MQTSNFNSLTNQAITVAEKGLKAVEQENKKRFPREKKKVVKAQMEVLAEKNKNDLAKADLPDFFRVPTADELVKMRKYAINYKRDHRQASKREVRKATQNHFNIQLYK